MKEYGTVFGILAGATAFAFIGSFILIATGAIHWF